MRIVFLKGQGSYRHEYFFFSGVFSDFFSIDGGSKKNQNGVPPL